MKKELFISSSVFFLKSLDSITAMSFSLAGWYLVLLMIARAACLILIVSSSRAFVASGPASFGESLAADCRAQSLMDSFVWVLKRMMGLDKVIY